jgi:hypothetical protein
VVSGAAGQHGPIGIQVVCTGAMRVRVTFLSGTPLVIEGVFFGPSSPISC